MAFAYAGKYLADDRPMPATDDDIAGMLIACTGRVEVRWIPDVHQALAMAPAAMASFAIARAVHRIACLKPRPGYPTCGCGPGPNAYGPWRT